MLSCVIIYNALCKKISESDLDDASKFKLLESINKLNLRKNGRSPARLIINSELLEMLTVDIHADTTVDELADILIKSA